jgi:sugar transferase (PEP-CTERM/EpsH1 system associated)
MSKVIVLTSRFPYPLEKGDKLRIYNQIKELSQKHEITLITTSLSEVSGDQLDELKKYCKNIHVFRLGVVDQFINLCRSLFNGLPFEVGLFYSPSVKKKIHRIIADTCPSAIYCHLIRMSEYVKGLQGVPKTLDYMDAFSKGMQRRAERSGFVMKVAALWEYHRLLKYEQLVFDAFDTKIIISEQDKALIPHDSRKEIHVIENGVDTGIFHPLETEKKYDLLFTGNMGYPPNIEAAIYAASEILPEVHKQLPGVSLLIAGINPGAAVRGLASETVHVIPDFENIRDAFAMSRINLAPMLTSIGLQNKILQAMAMKVPNICSTLANNAVKAIEGESILEADSTEQYAGKIVELLKDPKKADAIAESAYSFVLARYNWAQQNEKLEKLIFPPPEFCTDNACRNGGI